MADLEEIVTEDKLKRTIEKKKLSCQFIDFLLADTASTSFTFDAAGSAGAEAVVTVTLQNSNNLKLFGTPHFTFYESSVDSANIIQGGANIAEGDYEVIFWMDLDGSDGNNLVFKARILNNTVSSQSILVRVNWRFIVEAAETA